MKKAICYSVLIALSGCSPLRTSPNDEKHQLELTLHEVQTNLDDLKHGSSCFQTELQILEGRIKYFENAIASLKQNELEKQKVKLDQVVQQLQTFEKGWSSFERKHLENSAEMENISSHAREVTAALTQFKERIGELEMEMVAQNRKLDELALLCNQKEILSKTGANYKVYRVKSGDSLEKIARLHKTSVEKIKKLNDLGQDLIVAGQQLKVPVE